MQLNLPEGAVLPMLYIWEREVPLRGGWFYTYACKRFTVLLAWRQRAERLYHTVRERVILTLVVLSVLSFLYFQISELWVVCVVSVARSGIAGKALMTTHEE